MFKPLRFVCTLIVITYVASLGVADVFNMSTGLISLEVVEVGNPGNSNSSEGYGGVGYTYQIGKYEITAAQYTEFLNAVAGDDIYGLYNQEMVTSPHGCQIQRSGSAGSYSYSVSIDAANRPVNKISWADAARFVNWLHNGQPVGAQGLNTTEDGAYFLNGAVDAAALLAVVRKAEAIYAIANEDEWCKAAYHKNDGLTDQYWLYPTASDTDPVAAIVTPDPGNHANFNQFLAGSPWRTVVGEFENSASAYGTYDQGGNVYEMTEGLSGGNIVSRGGAYWYNDAVMRRSYRNTSYSRVSEESVLGFRIVVTPEPLLSDVFDMGAEYRSIEAVLVDNAWNTSGADGLGAVDYDYWIGTYEITAAQYAVFLNAVAAADTYGLYNTEMTGANGCQIERFGSAGDYSYSVSSDAANRPVNKISWLDAARFVNWLHHGQPTGLQDLTTTESGTYYLNGANSPGEAVLVARNNDWQFAIANEDEWFKAAYHKNDGVTDHYWLYPTASDADPVAAIVTPDPGNHGNFDQLLGSAPWRTVVGEFENSASAYGTYDQGGNVLEMTEALVGSSMVSRGGSYWANDAAMRKTNSTGRDLSNTRLSEENNLGFRVVIYAGGPRCGHNGYCTGDLDKNCYVDIVDGGMLADQWLRDDCQEPANCRSSDLNRDGVVNLLDFSDIAGQWQQCTDPDGQGCSDKKLIQIGWDMQTPGQLQNNMPLMQYMPFDGITIRTSYSYTFYHQNINPANVQADINTLQDIYWGKFKDNFFYFVTGANVDWFDETAWADDGYILRNIGYVAQAAQAAGCAGLIFDPEFIYWGLDAGPFKYEHQAQADTKSFAEIAEMARLRGSQFMTRIQQYFPNPVIMNLFWLTHGFSDAKSKYDPAARDIVLQGNLYGLLPAFMSGMLEAASSQTVIVDGTEPAYYYHKAYKFFRNYYDVHYWNQILVPRELRTRYQQKAQCGYGIYADYLCDTLGITVPSSSMSPAQRAQWVEHNVYWALKTADQYVWFYNEHIDWLTGDNMPDYLITAIESARQKIEQGEPLGFDF